MSRDPLAQPEELVSRVYSFVAYRIGPGPDAEDVTSETFARAVRHRHQYDPARGKPISWVLGIARRCLVEFYAERRPEPQPDALLDASSPSDIEQEALERLTLERALATLSERDAELVALRYGGDLSVRHIAEVLDTTPGAVRVALHRALARLRANLEDGEAAPAPAATIGFEPAK